MKRRRVSHLECSIDEGEGKCGVSKMPFSFAGAPRRFTEFIFFVACFSMARSQDNPMPSTQMPVLLPSLAPTTMRPTSSPITPSPTELPSQKPSVSASPTTSPQPSSRPTISPQPTQPPTGFPTVAPSFLETDISRVSVRQDLRLEGCGTGDQGSCEFNSTQVATIVGILEDFTPLLDTDTSRVETECAVDDQTTEVVSSEGNVTELVVSMDYTCSYLSNHVQVSEYSDRLLGIINRAEQPTFLTMLREEQLPVAEADEARLRIVQTAAPTTSPRPSTSPTMHPTISSPPSQTPTSPPTASPTARPTVVGITAQTTSPTLEIRTDAKLSIIVPISAIAGIGLIALVLLFARSWKKNSSLLPRYSATPNSGNSYSGWAGGGISETDMTDRNVVLSPTESLLSSKSLLSKGESGVGEESYDENDGTKNLQDEFDQFKDQNLEQLRANVEENLSGFEGIMSEAVTKALMGDDDAQVDTKELLWGCDANPSGTEVEASALYEVSDWLKRNEGATVERKRAFMQEILNKMVTSVRFGVLCAEVASRTIHESAAILNLELAEELPTTTVIISGMRKTTSANDMISALREFGDIDVAAVASRRRGFGIVRFSRQKSADRALRRYRSAEIVILDVSIQMKVIAQERTAPDEN